ncbi:retrovirus-related pol polyprotein from transposon TNT 1-94 [Tanacetum coccineum]|uniref:Retrovirus-related pol polyprotein from transposon TNT 1-94 n=1 Tax=Tanacetum coccineum TaxID=301880 RepID=A0ABQ4XR13_9ASTR
MFPLLKFLLLPEIQHLIQEDQELQERELQEEFVHEDQSIREQIERDAEIARIHAEEDLRQMINELDKSNVMINKHVAEYEEVENDLTIEKKTELITELINYQKDFARIKKYQAQQQSIQDFVPMDSKKESESLKRSGILLEKVKVKRLKISDVSAQEQQESNNQDEIINLQQWAVLVREESSVNITSSVVKVMFKPIATDLLWQFEAPIKSWKLYKSCKVHCLSIEGMIIYMLDDVEYPFQKTTLKKMLDHKCDVRFRIAFGETLQQSFSHYYLVITKDYQNDVECDDERVALANCPKFKLDVDENKKIQKKLKKANATLTQAQYEKPCLYAIPHDQSDPANRLVPDREEILTLEEESRSKLNKDLVKPFDYTKLNSLYEIFKPPTQHYEIQFAQANEIRKKMWRKSFVKTKPNIFKNINFLPVSKSISKSRQAYNVMTNNINHLKEIVDQAWVKHSNDRLHLRNPTAQDMEILVKTCLMPLALKTQNDSFAFVHELKQEMHADLKYVESLEDEIDELESDKAEFSNMYDMLLQEFCKEKASNVFRKEREQYFEIQDLKAQLQDKNIAISELKKLIEKWKGKSVDTKFDKPSVVRQPNAQRIPKPSVLGKPAPFSDSLERTNFAKKKSVSKTNESEGLSKPVTPQNLPQTATQAQYYSQSSTTPPSTYVPPHFADNTLLDSGLSPTDNLIENLTNTLALLTQSYKTYLPQTNNQLRTSSNTRNQATVQDGKVVVQNVQGRHNRGQGNNVRGAGAAGYGGAQNRVGNANPGQARQIKRYNCNGIGHIARNCTQPKRPQNSEYFKDKMLLMQAQENKVALDEEQLLFLAGG